MKKKTVSGVTALTMLASATIPVYAAPIEEGVNPKGLKNPISTAKPAVDPMNVYTSFTKSVHSNSGDGSAVNPYNRFEDAIAQVADGGTIYIKSDKGAYLNAQDEYGQLPFLIDKNITIKPIDGATNAELLVHSSGIVLGADVTFENITLSFSSKYHDSIFANGHTLNLINVTRGVGAREIDLFAGGLYERKGNVDSTTPIYPIGNRGVINIETNDDFSGTGMSTFGNVYAGSMNGKFNGSAEINLSNNGKYKKLDLGAVKASGALEADAGNMFDTEEPLPPSENPKQYPVMNNVTINFHNYQISIDGTTGSDAKTNVLTSTVYPSDLPLKNVDHLTVKDGHITAIYENTATTPNVTLENGATLDLTKAAKEFTIENYNGEGIVMLRKDGKLNITNLMNGSIELQTEGAFNGTSGLVKQDHVYITTPNEDANITFTPYATQTNLELVGNKVGTEVEWKIQEVKGSTKFTQIIDFVIEDADAKQVKKYDEINKPNDMGGINYEAVKFPFKASINADLDDPDVWVDLNEYPFEITVNGSSAVYREGKDEGSIGSHYFVEDLGLAIYFNSETFLDEHELIIMGYTEDEKFAPIKEGEYEIHVSHDKNDGTSAEFTSYLTVQPPVESVPTNGIENLKGLDNELQKKVDSLIAEVVMTESGLTLDITGADEDLVHVNEIEITEEGIFVIVDGEKLKFGVALDGLELDITNTRALRSAESYKYSAIPHRTTNEGLKITSNNFENILITAKVAEPFVDVEDKHWFKGDVEEAFNYAFTLGTSATTYEPNKQITRGEFAVMIARALELKPDGSKEQFKDINGKWYKNGVQALKDAGIVNGFVNGTFGGDKTITRQEAATMLVNMLKYANVDTTTKFPANLVDMDKVGAFAKPAVQFLAEKGVLSGNQNKEFKPLNNLTRAEMAKILVKSLKLTDLY